MNSALSAYMFARKISIGMILWIDNGLPCTRVSKYVRDSELVILFEGNSKNVRLFSRSGEIIRCYYAIQSAKSNRDIKRIVGDIDVISPIGINDISFVKPVEERLISKKVLLGLSPILISRGSANHEIQSILAGATLALQYSGDYFE